MIKSLQQFTKVFSLMLAFILFSILLNGILNINTVTTEAIPQKRFPTPTPTPTPAPTPTPTPTPSPAPICPCNYDLAFWTKPEWSLVDSALFDTFKTGDETILLGETTISDRNSSQFCQAVLNVRRAEADCFAEISCTCEDLPRVTRITTLIYGPEQKSGLTEAELDACEKDIKAIAKELGI